MLAGPLFGSSTTNDGNSSSDLNQNVRVHFARVVRSVSDIRHRCVRLDSSVIAAGDVVPRPDAHQREQRLRVDRDALVPDALVSRPPPGGK